MGYSRKSILNDSDIRSLLISHDGILKNNKNYVRFYCAYCQKEMNIDFKLAKQIKKAHICPNCFTDIKLHREDYVHETYGLVRKEDKGYYYLIKKQISKKPMIYIKQVAYWDDGKFYARNIARNMYGWTFHTDWEVEHWYGDKYKKYRLRKSSPYSYSTLEDFFKDYEYIDRGKIDSSKKRWIESLKLPELKSNQKKLIIDNLLNLNQMLAIAIFDLKSIDDVYKYNRYINDSYFIYHKNTRLNIFYLDYLSRNNIKFGDFVDFINQCKTLGIKLYKPKDFQKEHEQLTNEIEIRNEAKKDSQIKKVYKKLDKLTYEKENIKIKPFVSVRELIDTGAILHNCLKTYIDDYAKKKTDLFYIKDKEKVIGAIEVYKNKLKQARAAHNKDLKPRYKRIVNTWYKEAYGQGS